MTDSTTQPARPSEERLRRAARTVGSWLRALPERHGGLAGLALLIAIVALGLGLRLEAALDPVTDPRRDSVNYQRIATALYRDGRFGDDTLAQASDYSPGAPLLFAGVYRLTGAPYAERALAAVALLGGAMVLMVYLLARRLAGRDPPALVAALGAALVAAVYPPFIEYSGRLMSEPVAAFLVVASVLAFLWALERERIRSWLAPGVLLGATALTRPEYLPVAAALIVVAFVVVSRRADRRKGLAAAALLAAACAAVLAPWTIRNYVVLDRVVPVSTGGGKALFIGTYLPGDGSEPEVRRRLLAESEGRHDRFDELLGRLAARYPQLDRDQALARLGRENLRRYARDRPGDYARMLIHKLGRIWWRGPAGTADYRAWGTLNRLLLLLSLGGLVLLARARRVEALVIAIPIAAVTAAGMLLLASTRRSAPLMPLVLATAAVGAAALGAAASARLRRRRGGRAAAGSPPPRPL